MTDRIWGKYLILRAVNHRRVGECTNLGCAVYGPDGLQVGYKVDPNGIARAIQRGDLKPEMAQHLADYADNYLESHPSISVVEKSYGSMGHAMSCIQLGPLLSTTIEPDTVDSIYERQVLGKK